MGAQFCKKHANWFAFINNLIDIMIIIVLLFDVLIIKFEFVKQKVQFKLKGHTDSHLKPKFEYALVILTIPNMTDPKTEFLHSDFILGMFLTLAYYVFS